MAETPQHSMRSGAQARCQDQNYWHLEALRVGCLQSNQAWMMMAPSPRLRQSYPPKNFRAAVDDEVIGAPMGHQADSNPGWQCEHYGTGLSARVQGMAKPEALC
jgi:hypothetical protein